jgi:hypothetical protein
MTYFNNHQYNFFGGISSTKYFKVEGVLQAYTVLPSRRNRLNTVFVAVPTMDEKMSMGPVPTHIHAFLVPLRVNQDMNFSKKCDTVPLIRSHELEEVRILGAFTAAASVMEIPAKTSLNTLFNLRMDMVYKKIKH